MLSLFPMFISLQNNNLPPYYPLQVTSSFFQYPHELTDLKKFDEFQSVAIITMFKAQIVLSLASGNPSGLASVFFDTTLVHR